MAEGQKVEAIAEIAAAAVQQAIQKPPPPLPPGWVLKESRSNPEHYYYFHQETGECSWTPPFAESVEQADNDNRSDLPAEEHEHAQVSTKKRSRSEAQPPEDSNKRTKSNKAHVLHILRKHKDSRRASSWRVKEITISKEEAIEELEELMEMLNDVKDDPVELRATMVELARTESDCSSAKRGGDVGVFGPGKMQPEFERASFELGINELSKVVSTKSGVHVILRIG